MMVPRLPGFVLGQHRQAHRDSVTRSLTMIFFARWVCRSRFTSSVTSSVSSGLSMLFKLAICAEQSFRRLKGFNWLAEVIRGVKFIDGVREDQQLVS
jgi:hypothetical protein